MRKHEIFYFVEKNPAGKTLKLKENFIFFLKIGPCCKSFMPVFNFGRVNWFSSWLRHVKFKKMLENQYLAESEIIRVRSINCLEPWRNCFDQTVPSTEQPPVVCFCFRTRVLNSFASRVVFSRRWSRKALNHLWRHYFLTTPDCFIGSWHSKDRCIHTYVHFEYWPNPGRTIPAKTCPIMGAKLAVK